MQYEKNNQKSQIVIYKAKNGQVKIDVRFENETVWLTQNALADLFQTTKQNISQHIKNIFEEGELQTNSVVKDFLTTATDGKNYSTNYYNLDLIISVGYRVKSSIATAFRQWATAHLREYIIKGFVLDDERLKNPDLPFDYFEELTRRIAEIRTSEKRFYRKITDIYVTSVDYDPTDEQSILFFKTVQNKVHYAVTGNTVAEIIANRVDSKKLNIGLTNFRGNKPTKEETLVAKNYLNEQELLVLNNLVEQYLVFAEGQAMQRIPMYMKDWIERLNEFLKLNRKDILKNAGKISHELAKELAEKEYHIYYKNSLNEPNKTDSDFDVFANSAIKLLKLKKKK
ncbi:virulence RhuM family protein [Patescibacteria group bacterium]|nr:virulence RhuM family protein [Patescibacteria group bacterium]MBU0879283.1 virulence RhuM family protein [Patescibacteria group bacterium]MBU0880057.1 virulence RhuM family protein [Patescibacteria group bacterium]MBU1063109.1 virulence RhuM family protein [Patescibacteria group bacterium]MBU1783180.1 virulence RhuM family protein [Patescibacteria group bacterium]